MRYNLLLCYSFQKSHKLFKPQSSTKLHSHSNVATVLQVNLVFTSVSALEKLKRSQASRFQTH